MDGESENKNSLWNSFASFQDYKDIFHDAGLNEMVNYLL